MKQLKTLLPYLKKHWLMLGSGFFFMLVYNFGLMKIPGYFKKAVDEIANQNRSEIIRLNFIKIILFTLVVVISLFLMRKLIIGASRKIEYLLRERIFNKLMCLGYLFFQENETGDLVSRSSNDLDNVRTLLGPGIMYVPNSVSRLALFLPVLIGLSGSMILIIAAMMGVLVLAIIILLPRSQPYYQKIQEMAAIISNRVWQTISGISTLKFNNLEEIEVDRFQEINREYIKKHMAVVKYEEGLWPFFMFLFSLTELIILLVGGQLVIKGQLTIGELFQFNIMIADLTFPILSLGWIMSLMQQGISAMKRINYILEQPEEECQGLPRLESDRLTFEIRNLDYSFPVSATAAALEKAKPGGSPLPWMSFLTPLPPLSPQLSRGPVKILDNINMTLEPGQTIGITGKIGSGKSTLLLILTGLLKPSPGKVFINGQDICYLDQESLHAKISVVSQEPFLFSRTIAENIALGMEQDPGPGWIAAAASDAGLARDIQAFPDGYQQMVGERGITLSGGQKQRTAIARALCRRTPVLILDDPLSNVDSRTEEQILKNLKKSSRDRTLVIVSHRISALKNADIIYVMDEGKIVEQGSHLSLVHKKGFIRGSPICSNWKNNSRETSTRCVFVEE